MQRVHLSTRQPPRELPLLRLHLTILLHMDVFVRLQNTDLILWELDRETLDQGELVLDLPAVGLGLILRFGEFLRGGVLFEGHLRLLVGGGGLGKGGVRTLYIGILRGRRVERN
jgi:hypothetical protein